MSAQCPIGVAEARSGRCPNVLSKPWHLCCASHWAQVPVSLQQRLYSLYRTKRGTHEHRELCLEIIGELST